VLIQSSSITFIHQQSDVMKKETARNKVFIATSLDGYIAEADGKIDFLHAYPDPVDEDMGWQAFMSGVDAILMGRRTYETVIGFGIDWPYSIPVYVWSSTLTTPAAGLDGKVTIISGTARKVLEHMHGQGKFRIYVDGGLVIQSFLSEDLIDEMIITTIPILLGSGIRLFGDLGKKLMFRCTASRTFSNGTVQSVYERMR
jgi:dihydrofolate reductase